MKIYNQNGFSLIELLLTTALISIVTAIGVPSMSDFIKNDRLSTQINTLVGHLSLARSQAVTLAQPVSVCASSDLATCSSDDWANGWLVYVDADSSGDFSTGDELLRVHEALPGNSTHREIPNEVIQRLVLPICTARVDGAYPQGYRLRLRRGRSL